MRRLIGPTLALSAALLPAGCQPREMPLGDKEIGEVYALVAAHYLSHPLWEHEGKWRTIFVEPGYQNWSFKGRLISDGKPHLRLLLALDTFADNVRLATETQARSLSVAEEDIEALNSISPPSITLAVPPNTVHLTFGRMLYREDGTVQVLVRYYFSTAHSGQHVYTLKKTEAGWEIVEREEIGHTYG